MDICKIFSDTIDITECVRKRMDGLEIGFVEMSIYQT